MSLLPKSLHVLGARARALGTALELRQKQSAVPAQDRAFRGLVRAYARTAFGRAVGLEAGWTYAQFRARVPLQTAEMLAPAVARMKRGEADVLWPGRCSFYALTPGTVPGPAKWIPMTFDLLTHFRRANRTALMYYCARTGHARVFQGRHLSLGGSTALSLANPAAAFPAYEGELAGFTALNQPRWVQQHLCEPGADIDQLGNWDEKLAAIVARTRSLDLTLVAGLPNWLLVLAEAFRDAGSHNPMGVRLPNLQALWPNLECLLHTGMPLGPFQGELRRAFGPTVNFHEVYSATEGVIAAQDATAPEGLRLLADAGLFFEFLPLKDFDENRLAALAGRAVPLEGVEVNEDYVLVLTTPGGLCRYLPGDIVRFISTTPPRLIPVGRTRLMLDAFGEHVIEKELTDALLAVCSPHGWSIINFHVAPAFIESHTGNNRGRHEWWIELRPGSALTPTGPVMAERLDGELRARNPHYELKRRGVGIEAPVVRLVMPGVFEHWMRHHGKWGGQNKMPRCRSDRVIADELMQLARFNE